MPHPGRLIQPLFQADPARLPDWVLSFVRREELFHPGDRVLVAVSGGPDSVALLHLLAGWRRELGLELAVGHFDHTLRGGASQADAVFVADLAKALGLPCHLGRGDVKELARRQKLSVQMAARQLRLDFLRETCRARGYGKLALAHTADDQVELFFLRLLRGAGPEGLKGMWPATPEGTVRPLLAVGKAALLAWLERQNLPYRLDLSNLSRAYLRNRIRLDLLPELQRLYNPRLPEAVWRTQALLQEEERLLALETARLLDLVARSPAPDFFLLDLRQLRTLDPGWQLRLLRAALGRLIAEPTLSAAQTASLLDLAHGEQKRRPRFPGRGAGSPGRLRVAPLPPTAAAARRRGHPAPGAPRHGGLAAGLALDLEHRPRLHFPGASRGRAGSGKTHFPPPGPLFSGRRSLLAPGRARAQETPGLPGGRQNSPLAAAPYSPGAQPRPDRLGGRRPPGRTGEGDRGQPHPPEPSTSAPPGPKPGASGTCSWPAASGPS